MASHSPNQVALGFTNGQVPPASANLLVVERPSLRASLLGWAYGYMVCGMWYASKAANVACLAVFDADTVREL